MIRMPVRDEDGIDFTRWDVTEQTGNHRISGIDEQPEPVVLDQVATAGLVGRRPRAASAEDRKSHARARYMVECGIAVALRRCRCGP